MTTRESKSVHPPAGRYPTGYVLLALFVWVLILSCSGTGKHSPLKTVVDGKKTSIIRVNATQQGYNFNRPWQQLPPKTHTAIGVIIDGAKVLVTASHLANHRYIELQKIDSGEKSEARLEAVDYEANLALLKAADENFLKGMQPISLATDAVQGDELDVWQVNPNGNVIPTKGTITAIEPALYYFGDYFLVYRLNGSLQYQFQNVTLPVIKNNKLAGLVMHYDAKGQTINALAAPVIAHFLKDVADIPYRGFPSAGIRYVSAEDPQLRNYLGLPDNLGGIYVEGVVKNGAADRAGIRVGDMIYEIAGHPIDSHGNYTHAYYGKMSLSHLIRCEFHVGEKVEYKVFRSGEHLSFQVVPDHKTPDAFLVPPYIVDAPPRYYVLGGLVFQELSASYMRIYGENWRVKAPVHLVYYQANQHSFEDEVREKIVFLSGVLPTSFTIGYEKLSSLVVTHVNHQIIGKLEDIPNALKTPVDGFHKIEFEQQPRVIYLDPDEIPTIHGQVLKRYHLPKLEQLD